MVLLKPTLPLSTSKSLCFSNVDIVAGSLQISENSLINQSISGFLGCKYQKVYNFFASSE